MNRHHSSGRRRLATFAVMSLAVVVFAGVAASTSAGSTSRHAATPAFLAKAQKLVDHLKNPPKVWLGPKKGPKITKGKTIILITPLQVPSGPEFAAYLKKVTDKVGWHLRVIDQTFNFTQWTVIVDQAIALHPDGIIATIAPNTIPSQLATMQKQGITYLDYDNWTKGGPDKNFPAMFAGINSPAYLMGQAKAAWGIVQTKGHARYVNVFSNSPGISTAKGLGALNEWKTCPTCTELANFSSSDPAILNSPTGSGALMSGWISKYGSSPFYISIQTDVMIPNFLPSLYQTNVPSSKVVFLGDGGYADAYARIRKGDQYQQMTMAEPLNLYAYWAVDEFNRSFHHQKASGYQAAPLLVDKTNINKYGGVHDRYDPPFPFQQAYYKIWGIKG